MIGSNFRTQVMAAFRSELRQAVANGGFFVGRAWRRRCRDWCEARNDYRLKRYGYSLARLPRPAVTPKSARVTSAIRGQPNH